MTTQPDALSTASWESWTCPRCACHVTYRSFCPQCSMQLSSVPVASEPAPQAAPVVPVAAADPASPVKVQPDDTALQSNVSGRRSPKFAVIAAVVVLAIALTTLAGGAAVGAVSRHHDNPPAWAASWDPRVADLVSYVEQERHLTFKHPVRVNFLTPDQYHAKTTT